MVNTINSSFVFFTVLLACTVYNIQAHRQQITLYDEFNQVGQNLTIVAKNVLDLKYHSFNGKVRSACFTGSWVLYGIDHYNEPRPSAEMEYYFGYNSCVNLANPNDITSLRYAGSGLDYTESSITFYIGTNFVGQEAYIERDLPNLNWNGQSVSIIVTGGLKDSWTLYEGQNYSGNAVCVSPRPSDIPYQPLFISDTTAAGFKHKKFGSVRKGCFEKNTINNAEAIAKRVGNELPTRSKPFFP